MAKKKLAMGTFEPEAGPDWNDGKGTPLLCPDCQEETLGVYVYSTTDIVLDCDECGAMWRFVRAREQKPKKPRK